MVRSQKKASCSGAASFWLLASAFLLLPYASVASASGVTFTGTWATTSR